MADTIKEYLIGLGFNVDDHDLGKFKDALTAAGLSAAKLGAKAAGAGAAVAAMVAHIAEKYEDLYFASFKTNASAQMLQQFAYGSEAIGISALSSLGSLQRFNLSLLANPGRQFLLNYLGVVTAGKSTKQAYDALVDRLAEMPRWLAFAYGAQFGLTPDEINQRILLRRQQAEAEADYARRAREAGIDMTALGEKSNTFMQATRQLESEIELIGAQVADKWLPTITDATKAFEQWTESLAKMGPITNGWSATTTALVAALSGMKILQPILNWFGLAAVGAAAGTAVPVVMGAGATISALNALENQNQSGLPVDEAAIAELPWWRRAAISIQRSLFGADPNRMVPELRGGVKGGSSPYPAAIGKQSQSHRDAYNTIRNLAIKAGSPDPDMTASIAMHESGWLGGGAYLRSGGTNPFGQTAKGGGFMRYNSLEEGVADHVKRWGQFYGGTLEESLQNLMRHGYNTVNPEWAPTIHSIYRGMDEKTNGAGTPPKSPWTSFDEKRIAPSPVADDTPEDRVATRTQTNSITLHGYTMDEVSHAIESRLPKWNEQMKNAQ